MLDAGSVTTTLGFKVDPAGAKAYENEVRKAAAAGDAAEAKMVSAAGRVSAAHEKLASSASKVRAASSSMVEGSMLKSLDRWDQSSQKASQNLRTLGSVATKTAAIGILAVGAATVYAAAKASAFNREMLKIATQAGGSAQSVGKLKTEVLALAGQVPQGPQQLAEGLYHIQSAGFRGAQSMEMLKAAAEGAALGNADLQATAQAMIATTASQIKGVHGAADAMGQLNDIVGVGDMRMEQLAQAMATGLLPSAANAGLSLKDVGAALATVTDNATPANVTATRLRMTIALMAAPSKAAQKALGEIGITGTQLAADMRQPNGLLKAVEDLKTHLHDSGKTAEEQDAILTKAFGGGRSSAVIQTLIAETDRLRTKYDQLGQSNGPAKLAKSWAEFQKSESAGFGELKSGAEAFAITIGDVLMPELTKLAHGGAQALQGFISSGGAAQVGHDIEQAFSTIGQVFSNLAPPIDATAKALLDVGKAAGLTNGSELSSLIAGFLAFKTVGFVAPILIGIKDAISGVYLAAATSSSLAEFAAGLSSLGLLVPGIGLAFAAAAAGFIAIESGLFSSASAAEKNASALKADKAALDALNKATTKTIENELEAKQAKLDHKAAAEQLQKAEKANPKGGAQVDQARLNEQRAALREQTTLASSQASLEEKRQEAEKTRSRLGKRSGEVAGQIKVLERENSLYGTRNRALSDGENAQKRLTNLRREYNDLLDQEQRLIAQVSVSELSRRRKEVISPGNAPAIADLQAALSSVPKTIRARIELGGSQETLAQLGQITNLLKAAGQGTTAVKILTNAPSAAAALLGMRAVLAGVPASKVIHILHNAPSAQAAMSQLHGAINAVPGSKHVGISTNAAQARSEIASVQASIDGLSGKTIAVAVQQSFTKIENVVKRVAGHASGRGAGGQETAWVGEGGGPEYVIDSATGKGYRTHGPAIVGLSPSEYVVPTEDRYRGRALGLFAMLARDLNVPGYKGGRPAHKAPPMPIPDAIQPLSIPLSDIESKQSAAKAAYDKWHSSTASLTSQVATASRDARYAKSGPTKAKDQQKLREAQAKLRHAKTEEAKHHKELQEWNRTLAEAKSFAAKIKHTETEVTNDRNAMAIAAGQGNYGAYSTAKTKRLAALHHLAQLVEQAQAVVKPGSQYALELEGQLQNATSEAESTEGEEPPALTPAQEKERKALEAGVALAALTPGLGDDTSAAQQLVSFFETALSTAQSRGAGPDVITELAGDVKTARSNLESLTSPSSGATNENADVQAQLNQANERAENEKRRANIAEGALGVLNGPGDIGQGGANAAAAVVQNIYTLHPGDPATQRAIAEAAAGGFGYQRGRPSPRVRVGP